MAHVQLTDITLNFGERRILDGINLNLSDKSKTALSGGNGSGKSTLMKIIAGISAADSGDIIKDKKSRVAYLPQSGIVMSGRPLIEEAETAFEYISPVIAEKEDIEHRLSGVNADSPETAGLLEKLHELQESIEKSGYYSRRESASAILTGLGFSVSDFNRNTDEFSGGWQMRIALARLLLSTPDVILLDEPTNYLDLEARNWLENYLNSFQGGFLIVSHDRFFLDATVNEVAELFTGKLKIYKGNYSSYEKKREIEIELLVKQFSRQQEEIAKLEEFINRFRYNASKANMVQSRIKQLDKIERIQIPESMKKIHFKFPQPPHSGRQVLRIEGLNKAYGDLKVINDMELQLEAGEKLVIAGRNGAGKSTLMRIIAGVDSDYSGVINYGSGVAPGYFSQDIESAIDTSRTVLEEAEADAPTHLIPEIRGMLGAFLFRSDDIYKSASVLSGGEKNRLSLLKLLLHPANLLILDEPTNHLDLQSKQVLLDALNSYTGTLVFVSHDRYFIENLATKVLELEDGQHRMFPGDYKYYLWRKENELEEAAAQYDESGQSAQISEAKLDHQEEKRLKNLRRKYEREEEQLMLEMEEIEGQIAGLNSKLHKEEVYSDPQKAKSVQDSIEQKEEELASMLERWDELEQLKLEIC